MYELQLDVPGLTRGEGVLETAFERYAPVPGRTVPTRPRSEPDPLDRREYVLQVTRRVAV